MEITGLEDTEEKITHVRVAYANVSCFFNYVFSWRNR